MNRGERAVHTKAAMRLAEELERTRTIALVKSLAHVLSKRHGNNDPGAQTLDALVTLLHSGRHRGNGGF